MPKKISKLNPKKRYLQIALNNTIEEAEKIIFQLPISDRIIIEAGTPLIKMYGTEAITKIKELYFQKITNPSLTEPPIYQAQNSYSLSSILLKSLISQKKSNIPQPPPFEPYVVADLKMMDRGTTEVQIAASAGANAAVALGHAPVESLNAFIENCDNLGVDSMIDMMNVEYPLAVLRKLKKLPDVVILHRGVDEERFNKEKQIPFYEIQRIKSNYDILISVAGGDTIKEVQRAIFNDADIVVVWKSFYQSTQETAKLAEEFLKEVK